MSAKNMAAYKGYFIPLPKPFNRPCSTLQPPEFIDSPRQSPKLSF